MIKNLFIYYKNHIISQKVCVCIYLSVCIPSRTFLTLTYHLAKSKKKANRVPVQYPKGPNTIF